MHRRGRIVHYVVEFKTIILTLNKFSFINLIKFDHHWREIMLQKLNAVDDRMRIHTCVKEKGGYFEHKLWHFNFINNTVVFLLTHKLIIINYQSLNYAVNRLCSVWRSLFANVYKCNSNTVTQYLLKNVTNAQTLMWRHNDVIGRNEYLISTLSESIVP